MQRRSFLKNAACIGACAGLMSAATRTFAADTSPQLALRLVKVTDAGLCVDAASCVAHLGRVQVRVSGVEKHADLAHVQLRAWFAGDAGQAAFDLASVGANGASSNLRFATHAERLISFEARSTRNGAPAEVCSAQCLTTSVGGGQLAPGQYWLLLHGADTDVAHYDDTAVLARLRLDVSLLAA